MKRPIIFKLNFFLMRYLVFVLAAFFSLSIQAQEFDCNVEHRVITDSWITDPKAMIDEFQVVVMPKDAPIPGGELSKNKLHQLKLRVAEEYPRQLSIAQRSARTSADSLTIRDSFALRFFFNGNPLVGGRPNDNTLAISNDGMLLSSYNTQLWGYDLNADTFLFSDNAKHPSFIQFMNIYADTNITLDSPFDPKLYYHPGYDRFVFMFLTGREPENSGSVVSFSSTNNPSDPWHTYFLSGNPLNDDTWTDFPQIAFNDHSMYLTLNQLYPDSGWVEGFVYSVCWQMDLEEAFNGTTSLPTKLWSDMTYDNKPIRYLRPVNTGLGPESDSMFFVGNRPFSMQNDTFFLLRLEGDVNDPSNNVNANVLIADQPYGYPPYAEQPDTFLFWTNDARPLGAVRFGNELHWVGNTVETASGGVGIYHGVIQDLSNPVITGNIIKHPTRDYGFPNICYMGTDPGDNQVAIFFNHSSDTEFAGNSIVYYDQNREYGPLQTLKEGNNIVNRIARTANQRWGDYTGIQRKYNDPQRLWVAGYYSFGTTSNGSWVTELTGPNDQGWPTSVEETTSEKAKVSVFPNPTADRVTVDFTTHSKTAITEISLYDAQGRLVKVLGRGVVKVGENQLTFSTDSLPAGSYHLVIKTGGESILSKTIIKE